MEDDTSGLAKTLMNASGDITPEKPNQLDSEFPGRLFINKSFRRGRKRSPGNDF
jgi:hypothetical protein